MKYLGLAIFLGIAGCADVTPHVQSIERTQQQGVQELTSANYDTYFPPSKPTVIEAYATWCGACKAMVPEIDKLSEDKGLQVLKYDVDGPDAGDLEKKLGIVTEVIPTVIFIGKTIHMERGYKDCDTLQKLVKKYIPPQTNR